jgi:tetratricopeptide (TPR) repeat protein
MKNKLTGYLFLLFVIACGNLLSQAQADPKAESFAARKNAFALYEKGNFAAAIGALKTYIKTDAKDGEAWNALGLAYVANGDLKDARKALQKAVNLAPQNSPYHANLAYAHLLYKKEKEALAEAKKAIALDAKSKIGHIVIGTIYLSRGKYKDALNSGDNAIAADKTLTQGYTLKSDALLQDFSSQVLGDLDGVEDIGLLTKAIAVLEECVNFCDKKIPINIQQEKIAMLKRFEEYFVKRRERIGQIKVTGPLPPQAPDPDLTPVQIIARPIPPYTEEARRNQVKGSVRIAVLFCADGKNTYAMALSGLPHGLTEQAMKAVRQLTFRPQTIKGQPVDTVKVVEYNFDIY